MGCDCNKAQSGAVIVWQWHSADGVKTYATETDARIERTKAGGQGPIIRTSQPAK